MEQLVRIDCGYGPCIEGEGVEVLRRGKDLELDLLVEDDLRFQAEGFQRGQRGLQGVVIGLRCGIVGWPVTQEARQPQVEAGLHFPVRRDGKIGCAAASVRLAAVPLLRLDRAADRRLPVGLRLVGLHAGHDGSDTKQSGLGAGIPSAAAAARVAAPAAAPPLPPLLVLLFVPLLVPLVVDTPLLVDPPSMPPLELVVPPPLLPPLLEPPLVATLLVPLVLPSPVPPPPHATTSIERSKALDPPAIVMAFPKSDVRADPGAAHFRWLRPPKTGRSEGHLGPRRPGLESVLPAGASASGSVHPGLFASSGADHRRRCIPPPLWGGHQRP